MDSIIIKKAESSSFYQNMGTTELVMAGNGVQYLQCKVLCNIRFIRHAFSTRIGGVSTGIWASMNLNFGRGDKETDVRKNFERFGEAVGIIPDDMVYSMQTHTTNVLRVGRELCGNGVTKPQSLHDVDGLVTNEPGVCLVTTYADCIPLYLVDAKQMAIGLSHSGWRGTVGRIGRNTVDLMGKEFGSCPEDIIVFIGPGICGKCYEVGEDTAVAFYQEYTDKQCERILTPHRDGKYLLDLYAANVINLMESGIPLPNIYVSDICTCCNPQLLFSHRASKGQRGGLCAFLQIVSD